MRPRGTGLCICISSNLSIDSIAIAIAIALGPPLYVTGTIGSSCSLTLARRGPLMD